MLCIQRRPTGGIRRNDRRLADLIGHGQLGPQLTRFTGHSRPVLALFNGGLQRIHALRQLRPLRAFRQVGNQPLENGQKFQLLAVFGLVDDLSLVDRRRVIRANVINEMKCLRGTFRGVGRHNKAAQREHGQHQPCQETRAGGHGEIRVEMRSNTLFTSLPNLSRALRRCAVQRRQKTRCAHK